MAVQDHPLYEKWLELFDKRNAAERHYFKAVMTKDKAEELARIELAKAQKEYDAICDELG